MVFASLCNASIASFPGHTREGTRLYTASLLLWRVSVCISFPSYIRLTWWMEHSFSIPCGSVSLCINSIPICFHTPSSCLCPCPHLAASTFSIYLIFCGCLVIDIILYCHTYKLFPLCLHMHCIASLMGIHCQILDQSHDRMYSVTRINSYKDACIVYSFLQGIAWEFIQKIVPPSWSIIYT